MEERVCKMSFHEPKFVLCDEKEREVYLSQTGNFTPGERSLFHKLCNIWEPIIPLKKLFNHAHKDMPNINTVFSQLLAKLKKLRMGIIAVNMVGTKRVQEGLILCEPDDKDFHLQVLNDELYNVYEDLSLPLPTSKNLMARGIRIPDIHITKANYQFAANVHISKKRDSSDILALQLPGNNMFLIPQKAITRMLTIQISKMQLYFQNEAFQDLGTTVTQKSFTAFRASIGLQDPVFWFHLSKNLNTQRNTLQTQQKIRFSDEFFLLTYFLENFLSAQMDLAQKYRVLDQKQKTDIMAILETVRTFDDYLMPKDLLANHIESMRENYEDFQNFRDIFDKNFLQGVSKKNLPELLEFEDGYLHGDNVKAFFLQRVKQTSTELYKHYLKIMSQYIKNSPAQKISIFNSTANFEANIADHVQEIDMNLSFLLKKPATVAESFIQSGRKGDRSNSVEDMKAILVSFFYPNEVIFKELQVIFKLDIRDIYRQTFLANGIIQRFILRITGKHESYTKKFLAQSTAIYRRMQYASALPQNYTAGASKNAPAETVAGARLGEMKDLPIRPLNADIPAGKLPSHKPTIISPRRPRKLKQKSLMASRREQDSAWMEFSKRLKE